MIFAFIVVIFFVIAVWFVRFHKIQMVNGVEEAWKH